MPITVTLHPDKCIGSILKCNMSWQNESEAHDYLFKQREQQHWTGSLLGILDNMAESIDITYYFINVNHDDLVSWSLNLPITSDCSCMEWSCFVFFPMSYITTSGYSSLYIHRLTGIDVS